LGVEGAEARTAPDTSVNLTSTNPVLDSIINEAGKQEGQKEPGEKRIQEAWYRRFYRPFLWARFPRRLPPLVALHGSDLGAAEGWMGRRRVNVWTYCREIVPMLLRVPAEYGRRGSSTPTQRDKVEGRDDDEWRQRVLCQL